MAILQHVLAVLIAVRWQGVLVAGYSLDDPSASHDAIARQYASEGNMKQAVESFHAACKFSDVAASCVSLGVALMRTGDYGRAYAAVTEGLRRQPKDQHAKSNMKVLIENAEKQGISKAALKQLGEKADLSFGRSDRYTQKEASSDRGSDKRDFTWDVHKGASDRDGAGSEPRILTSSAFFLSLLGLFLVCCIAPDLWMACGGYWKCRLVILAVFFCLLIPTYYAFSKWQDFSDAEWYPIWKMFSDAEVKYFKDNYPAVPIEGDKVVVVDNEYKRAGINYKQANTCHCPNGVARAAPDCTTDQPTECIDCNPGYNLGSDFTCQENVCVCPNGVARTAPHCTTDQATECSSCNDGYGIYDGVTCLRLKEFIESVLEKYLDKFIEETLSYYYELVLR